MAKKTSEKVVLENIELRPQVIGHTYQKKTNIGRVIILFAILILTVYFINDISVIVNNFLGKKTAGSISKNTSSKNNSNDEDVEDVKIEHYTISDKLKILIS